MTDPITQSMMQGAAGAAGDKVYVDDVFSLDMWKGNNANQRAITNGLDLSGEGGAVFVKGANLGSDWVVGDSIIGDNHCMCTNNGSGRDTQTSKFRSLTSNGFEVGDDNEVNNVSYDYISFGFRKQKQFFDIVEFTGTGSVQTIAHNLGSVPGMIIVKCYSTGSRDWNVYHREIASGSPGNFRLRIDSDSGRNNSSSYWNNTAPTDTHFTVGTSGDVNDPGQQFVAYLFAHNETVHGEEEDQSLIACGSYTGNGSNITVNIGWEPQFFLVKAADQTADWVITNTLYRFGANKPSNDQPLDAKTMNWNNPTPMTTTNARISQEWNGVGIRNESQGFCNDSGQRYIYLAVRTAVGLVAKPPAAGTDVFHCGPANGPAECPPGSFETNFPVDFALEKKPGSVTDWEGMTRKSGVYRWFPNTASGLPSSNSSFVWDSSTGFTQNMPGSSSFWAWSRSRGFDVQCTYAQGARTYNHNLGQVPEMIWVGRLERNDWHGAGHYKMRTTNPWDNVLYMNGDSAGNPGLGYWDNTAPTATTFTLGSNEAMSYYNIMVMLWCSVPGICKLDDYNGDGGTSNAVDCGFQPRYVMIKRVDSSGDWKIWDHARGTNVLRLNLTNSQVNDNLISFTSTGFTLISPDGTVNANGGRYIYHAQA